MSTQAVGIQSFAPVDPWRRIRASTAVHRSVALWDARTTGSRILNPHCPCIFVPLTHVYPSANTYTSKRTSCLFCTPGWNAAGDTSSPMVSPAAPRYLVLCLRTAAFWRRFSRSGDEPRANQGIWKANATWSAEGDFQWSFKICLWNLALVVGSLLAFYVILVFNVQDSRKLLPQWSGTWISAFVLRLSPRIQPPLKQWLLESQGILLTGASCYSWCLPNRGVCQTVVQISIRIIGAGDMWHLEDHER